MNKQYISLNYEVKKNITLRILTMFFFTILVLIFFTYRDITTSLNYSKKSLASLCSELEEFIVSQVLINNEYSVDIKIDEINNSSNYVIKWIPDGKSINSDKMIFKLPFNWLFHHDIRSLDGRKFGYLKINGSFYDDKVFISIFLERFILILFFFILTLILILPLMNKIPEEMVLKPLLDIMYLLRNNEPPLIGHNKKKYIEVEEIKCKIIDLMNQKTKDSNALAIGKLAKQVAHDIRSPLAVLKIMLARLKDIADEERTYILSATQRITDIANNLLNTTREPTQKSVNEICFDDNPYLLASSLESLCQEKSIEYAHYDISLDVAPNANSLFVKINEVELKCMLSNLINNSVEAILHSGKIEISLVSIKDYAEIKLKDNGIGIPKFIINNINVEKFITTKNEGNGLGLKHAYQLIKKNKGEITIVSKKNKGTLISIMIPLCPKPAGFIETINIFNLSNFIIVDKNDKSFHMLYKLIKNLNSNIKIVHLHTSLELRQFLFTSNINVVNCLFFVNTGIDHHTNVIEMIEDTAIGKQAILLIPDDNYKGLLKELEKSGLPWIAYSTLPGLTLLDVPPKQQYDAILIDDDLLVHSLWKFSASNHHKQVLTFSSVDEFMQKIDFLDKINKIYIDSNLGNGLKGEALAASIYERGFKFIYLATGESFINLSQFPWLKSVSGKMPPWEQSS